MKSKTPPMPLESVDDAGIRQWTSAHVQGRYQAETIAAGLSRASTGGTAEEVAAVLNATATEARLRYLATSALVLGIVSAVIALLGGALSILTVIFTLLSGERGIKSQTRKSQAIAGMVLAGIAIGIFVLRLVIK